MGGAGGARVAAAGLVVVMLGACSDDSVDRTPRAGVVVLDGATGAVVGTQDLEAVSAVYAVAGTADQPEIGALEPVDRCGSTPVLVRPDLRAGSATRSAAGDGPERIEPVGDVHELATVSDIVVSIETASRPPVIRGAGPEGASWELPLDEQFTLPSSTRWYAAALVDGDAVVVAVAADPRDSDGCGGG